MLTSWILDEEVLAVLTAIIIVVGVFAGAQALSIGRVVEPFSELGLLGPSGKIGGYPREAVAGMPILLNVYVGNHEGRTMYYRILVKVGDKSSTINSSIPLSAEPLTDIRVILGHNSSRIIPVNITLYEPTVNARLILEMWVYDEAAGGFKYHGRWNQLWINVTRSLLAVGRSERSTISQDAESRIAEAYLAIRRAEDAGGDVSEMIDLLNAALEYAYNGDLSGMDSLLDRVSALEPEVTRAGVEASRFRLYTTIVALAVFSSISLALYLYLRSNIWLLWARRHREWRVVQHKSSGGGGRRGAAKSTGELRVSDLIEGSKPLAKDARTAARELYRMARSGAIEIVDPNPPRTFLGFLLSRYNAGFIAASSMLLFGAICIYLTESSGLPGQAVILDGVARQLLSSLYIAGRVARYALGSVMVLFLPGYSLVEALYPDEGSLSPLERLALSIGLSLALVPLVGLILNYTPWGIRLSPVVAALTILVASLLLVSAYRKFTLLKLKVSAKSG
jgi:uncharacterized membrane protein